MNLYCPSCQTAFPGTDICPRCGIRLLTPSEAFTIMPERAYAAPDTIRATLLTRMIVGLTVASGLYVGLHEWMSVVGPAKEPGEESQTAVWFGFAMQTLAAVVGGLLAGAGRPLGLFTGLIVGGAVGGLSLLPAATSEGVEPLAVGLAVGVAVIGSFAGFVGSKIWPATSEVLDPVNRGSGSSLAHLAQSEDRARMHRQTDWLRVIIALTIALIGVGGSGAIRAGIRSATGGGMSMGGGGANPMVDLQVTAVLMLIAGLFVGSNTRSGPRHGLILGAAVGLISIALSLVRMPPSVVGLLRLFNIYPDLSNPNALLVVMLTSLLTCGVMGWFGAQLLPPLAPAWMLKRRLTD